MIRIIITGLIPSTQHGQDGAKEAKIYDPIYYQDAEFLVAQRTAARIAGDPDVISVSLYKCRGRHFANRQLLETIVGKGG